MISLVYVSPLMAWLVLLLSIVETQDHADLLCLAPFISLPPYAEREKSIWKPSCLPAAGIKLGLPAQQASMLSIASLASWV